jgi:N-acetyl-alpha-D-muramate 1-phosphate uridylyltransferase
MSLPVAIVAGGLARRLGDRARERPKALLEVAGKPFLDHQLRLLKSNGVERVVLCVGHLGERIAAFAGAGGAYGLEIAYSFDGPRLLGTAGAVRKALRLLDEAFFVLYGDSYLPCRFATVEQAFRASGRSALMTVYRNEGRFDQSNVEFDGGRIVAYDKQATTARMRHIDYGLGVFRAGVFEELPDGEPADLAGVYRGLLARGELGGFEVADRFYEVGSPQGIEDLERYLNP